MRNLRVKSRKISRILSKDNNNSLSNKRSLLVECSARIRVSNNSNSSNVNHREDSSNNKDKVSSNNSSNRDNLNIWVNNSSQMSLSLKVGLSMIPQRKLTLTWRSKEKQKPSSLRKSYRRSSTSSKTSKIGTKTQS
jgi:hypothetical protein